MKTAEAFLKIASVYKEENEEVKVAVLDSIGEGAVDTCRVAVHRIVVLSDLSCDRVSCVLALLALAGSYAGAVLVHHWMGDQMVLVKLLAAGPVGDAHPSGLCNTGTQVLCVRVSQMRP